MVEREEAKIYPGIMNTGFTKSAMLPPPPLLLHSCSGPSCCALSPLLPEAALGHQLSQSFLPDHSFPNGRGAGAVSTPHHIQVSTTSLF